MSRQRIGLAWPMPVPADGTGVPVRQRGGGARRLRATDPFGRLTRPHWGHGPPEPLKRRAGASAPLASLVFPEPSNAGRGRPAAWLRSHWLAGPQWKISVDPQTPGGRIRALGFASFRRPSDAGRGHPAAWLRAHERAGPQRPRICRQRKRGQLDHFPNAFIPPATARGLRAWGNGV